MDKLKAMQKAHEAKMKKQAKLPKSMMGVSRGHDMTATQGKIAPPTKRAVGSGAGNLGGYGGVGLKK